MIYVDTSVALAHLLAEDRRPPADLWRESLVASRLVEYEAWTRIHARGLVGEAGPPLRRLLERFAFLELAAPVLERAKEPFPVRVRTLDALHLASADFLRRQGQDVTVATYDGRLADAARAIDLELHPLE